jgi:F-type H+-transporting ATPase subunit alpha
MAQFASLATFAQFGAEDLDPVTRRQIARGERFRELLKQDENKPVPFENMVTIFYVANQGALEDIPVNKVRQFEAAWYDYVTANLPDVLKAIAESGELKEPEQKKLDEAVKSFKQTVTL